MISRIRDRNIPLVYGATLLLGVAYGVSIALTALHLDARGFSKPAIGTLAAWFAAGIVLLSIPMGAILRRVSARATLVASLAGYAASVAAFPWLTSYEGVAAARFLDGAFSVGIWVSSETILLARAERAHKAFVTSLYAIAVATGYVVGPLAARLLVSIFPMPVAFLASGVLALAASALVLARLDPDPPEMHARGEAHGGAAARGAALGVLPILARIRTACFATFAYGYFQSSVVLFLPLFLIESKGVAREETILIPAFFAGGMLLFSNVAGRLGDRVGHLAVMRALAAIGTVMVAGFVFLDAFPLMCAAVFVAGATLASISPLSLALQGVVVDAASLPRANALYNTFYASGMLLGPPVSSALFARLGGAGMLYHLAALWASFVAFTVVARRDDPAAARETARASAGDDGSLLAPP